MKILEEISFVAFLYKYLNPVMLASCTTDIMGCTSSTHEIKSNFKKKKISVLLDQFAIFQVQKCPNTKKERVRS